MRPQCLDLLASCAAPVIVSAGMREQVNEAPEEG